MSELTRPMKVGVMTVALGAALFAAYRFVSREAASAGGYRVHAFLPDVTGVAPKSRVMISGIQVGIIDRIALDHGRARLEIKMNPDVVLFEDAAVGKKASSLIGESYIVLAPGTEGQKPLQDGAEITHSIEAPSVESLEAQVRDVLLDVKAVTASLGKSVGSDQGQQQIADTLKNLAEVTEALNQTVRENREGVKATVTNINDIAQGSRPEIAAILANLRQVSEDAKRLTSGVGEDGKPGDVRSAIERVNRASATLESVLTHADNVAARIDRGEGTVGRLTKDDALVDDVHGVVQDVGDVVGGIRRLQTVVGLKTDYNFLANTVKSYVELRLQPSEDKYYAIELVNDPRGKTSFEQTDVDTTNPNLPPHYREVRTTTTNAFRFSFQFAKRLGPFTGRFGIKESTGSVGLDLHLLDDRFELRQDLFGFSEELLPRWRVGLAYEFIRKLWLFGGADDLLNAGRRDYFVGLQLRFFDQDIKTILPFAPKSF